ncbi:hypothetical protein [Seleniivibrio woodruffii]|uniref:hypothetical protein n=1 Tax=Seleniivibrio woodruffii TaxID=1078050 RepID=UPI0024091C02|nr:hypothetical protein [Seleniivibrio woodruffii]
MELLIINSSIIFLSILVFDFINKKIIIPLKFNTTRHKLFALRDNLALLAMSGKISENSEDYKFLMNMINSSIVPLDKFKITDFIYFVSEVVTNNQYKSKMNHIIKNLNNNKLPDEYKEILIDFFIIMDKQYNKYVTKFELLCIIILIKMFKAPKLIARKRLISETKSKLTDYAQLNAA